MLNCFAKRPLYFNKNLSDYCTKTTNESIRKLTEKNNIERNRQKLVVLSDDDNNYPKFNGFHFLLFLSISSITIFFYKRLN
jgi:hypothetical protein